jgi:hypothetical protein
MSFTDCTLKECRTFGQFFGGVCGNCRAWDKGSACEFGRVQREQSTLKEAVKTEKENMKSGTHAEGFRDRNAAYEERNPGRKNYFRDRAIKKYSA